MQHDDPRSVELSSCFNVFCLFVNAQLQFELPKRHIEKSSLTVQQKAVFKGLKMEVEVPKPTTKELSYFELQQLQRVEAIETQRQVYTMQVRLKHDDNNNNKNSKNNNNINNTYNITIRLLSRGLVVPTELD